MIQYRPLKEETKVDEQPLVEQPKPERSGKKFATKFEKNRNLKNITHQLAG